MSALPNNVLRLPRADRGDPPQASISAPPRVLEVVAEGHRSCLGMLPKFHEQIQHLAEKITVLDAQIASTARESEQAEARWSDYGNHSKHWTPLHWTMMWFGLLVLGIAETALAATVMAGLDLTDLERWLVAAGSTVGATLGVKAFAFAWKAFADDEKDRVPVAARHRWALWFGGATILLLVTGQFLARGSYADQAQAAGSAGVSWMVACGLTLLQCGLYGAAAFFLYARLPHVRTQQAYEQFVACRKVLTGLHTQRARLAAPLNQAVFTLRARWAEKQALARSLVFEYMQEMVNAGKQLPSDLTFDGEWLLPLPVWVKSADELTLTGYADQQVACGTSSPSVMAAAAARRDAMLLGKVYLASDHTAVARAPDATSFPAQHFNPSIPGATS